VDVFELRVVKAENIVERPAAIVCPCAFVERYDALPFNQTLALNGLMPSRDNARSASTLPPV